MADRRPTHLRLTPAAQADLEDIWLHGARTWSPDKADRHLDALGRSLEILLSMPEMARERREFNPPVRIHVTLGHLVIYRIEEDHLAILRILGAGRDWENLLRMLDD